MILDMLCFLVLQHLLSTIFSFALHLKLRHKLKLKLKLALQLNATSLVACIFIIKALFFHLLLHAYFIEA